MILICFKAFFGFSFLLFSSFSYLKAQNSFSSGGADYYAIKGGVSISVGQVFYNGYENNHGYISEGVQQPFETNAPVVGLNKYDIYDHYSIIPNPFNNKFILQVNTEHKLGLTYYIFDSSGRLIIKGEILEFRTEISITNNGPAMYFLLIVEDTDLPKAFKIIQQ